MSLQLPAPIERYLQIANSGTPEAAPECFATDAIVRDEGQTYEGRGGDQELDGRHQEKIRPHHHAARVGRAGRPKHPQGEARGQLSGKPDHGELQFRAGQWKDSRAGDRLMREASRSQQVASSRHEPPGRANARPMMATCGYRHCHPAYRRRSARSRGRRLMRATPSCAVTFVPRKSRILPQEIAVTKPPSVRLNDCTWS
jgi:hypothetical protein